MTDEYEELRRNGFPNLLRPQTEGERAHQHDLWLQLRYGPPSSSWMERHERHLLLMLAIGLCSFFVIEGGIVPYGQDHPTDAGPFLQAIGVLAVFAFICFAEQIRQPKVSSVLQRSRLLKRAPKARRGYPTTSCSSC